MGGRMEAENDNLQRRVVGDDIMGSLQMASARDFIGLLKMAPTDAALHRALADWLASNGKAITAAETYKKSVSLFLEQGRILPAIAAKLLQWDLAKPTSRDFMALCSQIHRCKTGKSPLPDFFVGLKSHQLAALLSTMSLVKTASNQTVIKFGTVEYHLYLVVSGALVSTRFSPIQPPLQKASCDNDTLREKNRPIWI